MTEAGGYVALRVPAGALVRFKRTGSAVATGYGPFNYSEHWIRSYIGDSVIFETLWTGGWPYAGGTNSFSSEKVWRNPGATQNVGLRYWVYTGPAGKDLHWEEQATIEGGLLGACNRAPVAGSELFGPNPAMGQQCGGCHGGTANSVDTATGNEHYRLPGVAIAGRGPGLNFQLAHNSQDTGYNGPLGAGWHNTYDMALSKNPDGTRSVFQETGSTVTFTKAGSVWSAPARFDAKLVQNGDGTWTYTRNRSEFFTFGAEGRLQKIADRNGYETTVNYDSNDLISNVEDEAGRKLVFTWSGGRIIRIADPLVVNGQPRALDMYYNESGDMIGYNDIGGGKWKLTYDSSHRLTSAQSPRFEGTSKSRKFHYDAQGRADWEEDAQGRRTTIHYDSPQVGATRVEDPAGHSRVDWYTNGLRTKVTTGWGEPGASETQFVYDAATQMPTQTIDPNGKTWKTEFTDSTNPFKVTKSTDPLGRTRTMTYDSFGQLLTLTSGEHVVNKFTYDSNGNPKKSTAAFGTTDEAVTEWTYGDNAHPGDVTDMTDARGKVWHYTYDATTGDRLSATDPVGGKTSWTYNNVGWVNTTTSPRGNAAGANPADFRTSVSYDKYGQPIEVKDHAGLSTLTEYDADGNITKVTDRGGNVTTRTYNDAGDLKTETTAQGTPDAKTTTYTYDPNDRMTSWATGDSTWSTSYDAHGRVSTRTDANNRVSTMRWDQAGNLTSLTQPGGSCTGTIQRCVTFTHDDAGQLTGVDYSDPNTPDVTRTYDDDGHRISETVAGQGASSWEWTKRGQIKTRTDAAGDVSRYEWDRAGNLTKLTYPGQTQPVAYSYDDAGRMASVEDWTGNHTDFAYNPDDQLTDTTYPSTTGLEDHVDYDNNGRVTGIAWNKPGGTALGSVTYGRNDEGQVTTATSTGTPAEPTAYTYDPRDQLSFSTGGAAGDAGYGYDERGYATHVGDDFNAFDAAGQLETTAHDIKLVGTAKASAALLNKTVKVTLPAHQADDQILIYASFPDSTALTAPPAGYTTIAQDGQAGGSRVAVFRKTADGTETTASATFSQPVNMSLLALVYRGVDTQNPVADTSTAAGAPESDGTFNVPSTGPVPAGSKLVLGLAHTQIVLGAPVPPPPGMTSRIVVNALLAVPGEVSDQTITRAGNSGPRTITMPTGDTAAVAMIALKPKVDTHDYDNRGNRTSTTTAGGQATTYTYDQANRLTSVNGAGDYAYDGDGLRNQTILDGTRTHESWSAAQGLPLLLTQTPLKPSGQLNHLNTTSYVYGPGGQILNSIAARPEITLVGSHSISNTGIGANSLTFNMPAGVQENDQIIIGVAYAKSATTPTTPAGYTTVGTWINGNTAVALWRRTATASEPATLKVTFSSSLLAPKGGVALVYRGVDPNNPLVDFDGTGTAPNGTSLTIPAIDAAGARDKLVAIGGANPALVNSSTTWTAPSDHTIRQQTKSNGIAVVAADGDLDTTPGTATNGPTTLGFNVSSQLAGAVIMLRQAPAPQRWYHHDQLGSIRIVTDHLGGVVGTASYTPYGKTAAATGELATKLKFGFAGQYTDQTGLQYLRARYYDPATAQFLTSDPKLGSTQDPYAYAANDPTNLTDPTGQCPVCLVMAAGFLSGGLADLGMQVGMNLILGCPAFHDISWGQVALSGTLGALTSGGVAFFGRGISAAAKTEHGLLSRARMGRLLNPERGSIGGAGFTGRATGHGAERLAEAGFDDIDVAIIRAGRSFEQTDGATAFVSSAGRNSYNMIIQNSDGLVVTAHRGMSYDDLAGLAQNYGWSGW